MSKLPSREKRKPPAQRRAEIAAAAHAIALESGLAAVTLRSVATRAGVTSALVAHYMPSMDELVAETFATVTDAELGDVGRAAAAAPTAAEGLARLLNGTLREPLSEVTLIWVQAWGLGHRNAALASRVRRQMDRWQGEIQALIERGVREGEFETSDAGAVAWHILGMIDGLNAQSLVHWGPGREPLELMNEAVEGWLRMPAGALRQGTTDPGPPATA